MKTKKRISIILAMCILSLSLCISPTAFALTPPEELDLTHLGSSSGETVENSTYSYTWTVEEIDEETVRTLKINLKDAHLSFIIFPGKSYGKLHVIINTESDSYIGKLDEGSSGTYYYKWDTITFTGSGALELNQLSLQGGGNNHVITVESGANVSVSGECNLSFGSSGSNNSTLNVHGTLKINGNVHCGQTVITNEGYLECKRIKLSGSGANDTDDYDNTFVAEDGAKAVLIGDTNDVDSNGNLYAALCVSLAPDSGYDPAKIIVLPDGYLADDYSLKIVDEIYAVVDDGDETDPHLPVNFEFGVVGGATGFELPASTIEKNEWNTPLSIEGWTYGDTPNQPISEPKYGTPVYTYSQSIDGEYSDTVPTDAGIWYVKSSVEGTEDYTEISDVKEFTISPKTISTDIPLKAPKAGRTPVAELETDEYTASIDWIPEVDGKYSYSTEYTATITITPKPNYTVYGIEENSYTVKNALVTNDADSGVATAVFEKTANKSSGGGGGTISYIVNFETNGGTKIKNRTVTRNSVIPKPEDPIKNGYVFDGWYTDAEFNEEYNFDSKVIKSFTLYAKWSDSAPASDTLNTKEHFAYVFGYPDGTVRPDTNITRAETATLFYRLLNDDAKKANTSETNGFEDVSGDAWYNTAVSTMKKMGIVKGRTSNEFMPEEFITRAEFAAICARFDESEYEISDNFTDIADHWAENEIHRAASRGWINGYEDGTFRPDMYITRAEAITMINKVLKRTPESVESLHENMTKWIDNNESSWYYIAVQEATNSHTYDTYADIGEKWIAVEESK